MVSLHNRTLRCFSLALGKSTIFVIHLKSLITLEHILMIELLSPSQKELYTSLTKQKFPLGRLELSYISFNIEIKFDYEDTS